MYKVVLVDDEPIISEGLRKGSSWEGIRSSASVM